MAPAADNGEDRRAMLNTALMQQRAYAQYQQVQAQTASPGQLLLLLYEG